jgi:hypothetical protein
MLYWIHCKDSRHCRHLSNIRTGLRIAHVRREAICSDLPDRSARNISGAQAQSRFTTQYRLLKRKAAHCAAFLVNCAAVIYFSTTLIKASSSLARLCSAVATSPLAMPASRLVLKRMT